MVKRVGWLLPRSNCDTCSAETPDRSAKCACVWPCPRSSLRRAPNLSAINRDLGELVLANRSPLVLQVSWFLSPQRGKLRTCDSTAIHRGICRSWEKQFRLDVKAGKMQQQVAVGQRAPRSVAHVTDTSRLLVECLLRPICLAKERRSCNRSNSHLEEHA